jgi:hypothetical protein
MDGLHRTLTAVLESQRKLPPAFNAADICQVHVRKPDVFQASVAVAAPVPR